MSSILTNNGAMVALQTLKTINKGLATAQNEIATGKRIATAKDNAAMWSISAVMNSDVNGFAAVAESLALGDATVGVARDGAETVTELLNQMKAKIVAAQEKNVDRTKIQADVVELRNQIQATVDGSQFNGLNLLKADADSPTVSILGSLNRTETGVSTSSISVDRESLDVKGTVGGVSDQLGTTFAATTAASQNITIDGSTLREGTRITVAGTGTVTYTVTADDLRDSSKAGEVVAAKVAAAVDGGDATLVGAWTGTSAGNVVTLATDGVANVSTTVRIEEAASRTDTAAAGGSAQVTLFDSAAAVDTPFKVGQFATMSIDGVVAQYEVKSTDISTTAGATAANVTTGVIAAMNKALGDAGVTGFTLSAAAATGAPTTNRVINVANANTEDAQITLTTGEGKLSSVGVMDVTSDAGAAQALALIDSMIQTSIAAAASFGTAQKRIETQSNFISKVSDSFKAGIGSITDTDMEAASAKLQALQVQQQLGVQALSIANQAPQNLLALFR